MDNTKEMLTLAVEIGDAMLRCGAEIYRVEDSVIRILEAFGWMILMLMFYPTEFLQVQMRAGGCLQCGKVCSAFGNPSGETRCFKSADPRYL